MQTIQELIDQINQEKAKLSSSIMFSDNDEFVDLQKNLLSSLSSFNESMDMVVGMFLDNREYFQEVSKDIKAKRVPRFPHYRRFPFNRRGWTIWFRPLRTVDDGYCFANIPYPIHHHDFHRHLIPFPHHRRFPHCPPRRCYGKDFLEFWMNEEHSLRIWFQDKWNEEESKTETFVFHWEIVNYGKPILTNEMVLEEYSKIESYKPNYLQEENVRFWSEHETICISIGESVQIVKNLFEDLLKRMLIDIQYTIEKTSPLTSDVVPSSDIETLEESSRSLDNANTLVIDIMRYLLG